MAYVADFDPSSFDQAAPATWPQPAPYNPGDWWYLTAPGTINGVPVSAGDRMFPVGTGRLYGELNYGDAVYGGPVPAAPWPADANRVRWVGRPWSSAPAWQRPPAPYDGVPFGDTGWRIAVEVLAPVPGARLYGDLMYGDAVYGDTIPVASDWTDLACHVAGATIRRGGADGSPLIDVGEMVIELVDTDAALIRVQNHPRLADVNTPIRVALIDPSGDPHPMFTGRIEQITDTADRPPRTVIVHAYGMAADLVRHGDVSRQAEAADVRLAALVEQTGYRWGYTVPAGLADLRRIDPTDAAPLRDLIDRTALSAGYQTVTDPYGVVTWTPWPTVPTGPSIVVQDCRAGGALPAVAIELVADTGELLNDVRMTTEEVQGAAAYTATASAPTSIARWGNRSDALGFPVTGLSALAGDLDALAATVRDRYSRIVDRVVAVEVDTTQDPRWLPIVADLDTGADVTVRLTTQQGETFRAVVVGVEHAIGSRPARVTTIIRLTTLTETQ